MFKRMIPTPLIPLAIVLSLAVGCDERVAEVAREAADRQAQQNETMAELQKEVASGSRSLVEADAEARREIVGVHRELQGERERLDEGWNTLETERQQIARDRRTTSWLVSVTKLVGGCAVVTALLGFCWYALFELRSESGDAQLNELLVEELTAERPQLLSSDRQLPRLTRDSDPPAHDQPPADG